MWTDAAPAAPPPNPAPPPTPPPPAGGPRAANRPHKPSDSDMGPHNFGGGEGKPTFTPRGRKPGLDEMGPGREAAPAGDAPFVRPDRPDPKVGTWKKGGRGRRA